MPDGTTLISQIIVVVWDSLKLVGLMIMGLIVWKRNGGQIETDIPSIDRDPVTSGLKHVGDGAGVGAVIIAVLDVINPVLETGIIALTFVWMLYRIKEIRANLKAKKR